MPDVTYLMSISNWDAATKKETEEKKQIWYFRTADLENLNHKIDNTNAPKQYELPSTVPGGFQWGGKMFDITFKPGPSEVVLRIGLIDKSDKIPAGECCKSTAQGSDPLPVGYAGWYAKHDAGWGILLPVFRPVINNPLIAIQSPGPGETAYKLARVSYYISTAPRPKVEVAIQESIKNNLKANLAKVGLGDDGPPIHIENEAPEQTDASGDFVNEERVDSFIDLLDNFIPEDGDAGWSGSLMPEGGDLQIDAGGWTGDASSLNAQSSDNNPTST